MKNLDDNRNGGSIFGLVLVVVTLLVVCYLLFFKEDDKKEILASLTEEPEISAELPQIVIPSAPESTETVSEETMPEPEPEPEAPEKEDGKGLKDIIDEILPHKDDEPEPETPVVREGYPDLTGYDIILMGDSIFAMCEDDSTVANKLSDLTGAEVYTVSKSGATASEGYYDLCSLPVIAETFIGNGAMNVGGSALADQEIKRYWEDDHTGKKMIFIFDCSINDYTLSAPIDNGLDDGTSLKSAYRNTINRIHEVFPEAVGVMMIPAYFQTMDSGHTVNGLGNTMYDYRTALKEVAQGFSMTVIDAYENCAINESNADTMLVDGLHPTEPGRAALAETLAKGLFEFE